MLPESELFDKQKQKALLRQVVLYKFEYFEQATNDTIKGLIESLKNEEEALKVLRKQMPDVDENDYHKVTEEEWAIIDEYTDLDMSIDFTKEYLLSLSEMKVVYLFKNLEILLKRIIQIAYPQSNIKDFYHWDNMKGFFKSKDIDIVRLDGYDECTELRKVNNAIKHNGIINDDVKRIQEFIGESEFYYINLEKFYERIKPKVERFAESLRDKVEKDLFEFPHQRLDALVNDYYKRMDEVTYEDFIFRLQQKLNPDKITGRSDVADDLPF